MPIILILNTIHQQRPLYCCFVGGPLSYMVYVQWITMVPKFNYWWKCMITILIFLYPVMQSLQRCMCLHVNFPCVGLHLYCVLKCFGWLVDYSTLKLFDSLCVYQMQPRVIYTCPCQTPTFFTVQASRTRNVSIQY